MTRRRCLLPVILWVLLVPSLTGQALKTGAPESVGMSAARLARIKPAMQMLVDVRAIPGAETLVARHGVIVHHEVVGAADPEAGRPLTSDTIYAIASMTKPITSLAVMMLCEEGRLLLSDPLSRFIPAFRDTRVLGTGGTQTSGDDKGTVPATRQITIEDLLTHRSGLSYGFLDRGPIGDMYRRSGVFDGLRVKRPSSLADQMELLARLPLKRQPGSGYEYSLSIDVLGRVVEVASGVSLDEFFRQRIFGPLGMDDTYFSIPTEKANRLAALYAIDKAPLHRGPEQGTFTDVTYYSGGAGLVSTASDYATFLQMLLNGGELNGNRLLSRKTVELMTTSHTEDLGPGVVSAGVGFGYGFSVRESLGRSNRAGSQGTYQWGGIFGTTFWVDPKEQLIAVLMMQLYPRPDDRVRDLFNALTYAAIVD
jgi:CubicO group peptidase (beta-lactamase class C family)